MRRPAPPQPRASPRRCPRAARRSVRRSSIHASPGRARRRGPGPEIPRPPARERARRRTPSRWPAEVPWAEPPGASGGCRRRPGAGFGKVTASDYAWGAARLCPVLGAGLILFLAALQGVTELFPVSSLGHAVVVPPLIGLNFRETSPAFVPVLAILH